MKAVLVVDFEAHTDISNYNISYVIKDIYNFPVKCENKHLLVALPEPLDYEVLNGNEYVTGYQDGWNDCLEEITGETE